MFCQYFCLFFSKIISLATVIGIYSANPQYINITLSRKVAKFFILSIIGYCYVVCDKCHFRFFNLKVIAKPTEKQLKINNLASLRLCVRLNGQNSYCICRSKNARLVCVRACIRAYVINKKRGCRGKTLLFVYKKGVLFRFCMGFFWFFAVIENLL